MIRTSFLSRRRTAISRTMVANGFTLMELLIVMAIIAILSLLAMASVVTYIKRANGISAVNSVQKIVQAEMLYSSSYPATGYACTLQALGGEPNSGPPSAQAAQLLPSDLAAGFKSGYAFTIACTDKVTVNGVDRSNGFTVSAVPQTVGKTGDRSYCSDESGQVKFDPAGGANCVQSLQ
jgi:type IV pilus assembly protein PilA